MGSQLRSCCEFLGDPRDSPRGAARRGSARERRFALVPNKRPIETRVVGHHPQCWDHSPKPRVRLKNRRPRNDRAETGNGAQYRASCERFAGLPLSHRGFVRGDARRTGNSDNRYGYERPLCHPVKKLPRHTANVSDGSSTVKFVTELTETRFPSSPIW